MVLMAPIAVQGVWTAPEYARMIINRYQRAGSVSLCLLMTPWKFAVRLKIFFEKQDKLMKVSRFSKILKISKIQCHSFCMFRIL